MATDILKTDCLLVNYVFYIIPTDIFGSEIHYSVIKINLLERRTCKILTI